MIVDREPSENGKYRVSKVIDEMEARVYENQNLLDPSSTPENLKEFAFGVGCPMPTRTCTREMAIALRHLALPMFGNPVFYSPDSLEVGEARNEIVRCAKRDGVEWLFFMDYDVAPPPNALRKLLNLKTPISAGVYHSKEVPSYPLLLVKGWPQAFDDYEVGDLVKVDGCGMGCTLIHMSVFDQIEPPYFKTVGHTTKDGRQLTPRLTEDIYFCNKARDAGFEIIVDTSVQCGHVDWKHGIIYHLVEDSKDSRRAMPGWTYRDGEHYITEVLARADHPGRRYAQTDKVPIYSNDNPPLDLGSGDSPIVGHLGVDPFATPGNPSVRLEDMRNLKWYRDEYGLAPALHSCHSLEHVPYRDVPATVLEWYRTLMPGGEICVIVPDGEGYMRSFVKRLDAGLDDSYEMTMIHNGLFGDEKGDGQVHQSIFTRKSLRMIFETAGFSNVEIELDQREGIEGVIPETAQYVLTARKAVPEFVNADPHYVKLLKDMEDPPKVGEFLTEKRGK